MNTDKLLSDGTLRLALPPTPNWRGKLMDTNVVYCVHSPEGFGFVRRFFWFVCFGVRWTKLPTGGE